MMTQNQKPPKLRHACNECHASKVKCSGERTGCRRCTENGQTCTYSVSMVGKVQSHRRRIRPLKEIAKSPAPSSDVMTITNDTMGTRTSNLPYNTNNEIRENLSPEMDKDTRTTNENFPSETVCPRPKDGQESILDFQMMDFPEEIPEDFMNFVDSDYLGHTQSLTANNDEPWYRRGPEQHDAPVRHNSSVSFSPRTEPHGEHTRKPNPPQPSPSQNVRYSPEYQLNHGPQACSQSPPHSRPVDIQSRRGFNRGDDRSGECSVSMEVEHFAYSNTPFSTMAQNNQQFQRRNTAQSSRGPMTPFSIQSGISSSTSNSSSEDSWRCISKSLVIISKLQKLVRDPSSVSLDVILATNKSALAELDHNISGISKTSAILSPEEHFSTPSSYFSLGTETEGRSATSFSSALTDPAVLMIYVVALKHIHELYSQACFIFTQESNHSRSSSLPSPSNSFSQNKGSCSFGLPTLDFGSFKIDVADQRRLFGEIIARELGNCLAVCKKVRGCFVLQPGDISAPSGLLEETFLGIEDGIQRMMKQIIKV